MFRSCLSCIPMGCCFRGAVANYNEIETTAEVGIFGNIANPVQNSSKKLEFKDRAQEADLLPRPQPIRDTHDNLQKTSQLPTPQRLDGGGGIDKDNPIVIASTASQGMSGTLSFDNKANNSKTASLLPRVLVVRVFDEDETGKEWARQF